MSATFEKKKAKVVVVINLTEILEVTREFKLSA